MIEQLIEEAKKKQTKERDNLILHRKNLSDSIDSIKSLLQTAKEVIKKEDNIVIPDINESDLSAEIMFSSIFIDDLNMVDIDLYNQQYDNYVQILKDISDFKKEVEFKIEEGLKDAS